MRGGIGIYEGIHKVEVDGVIKDFLKPLRRHRHAVYPRRAARPDIQIRGRVVGRQLKLNRLGGGEWQRQKLRVRQAVADLAKELIRLYAERSATKGFAFSPDSEWQREFEEKFEYAETDDQLRCAAEIKRDMERPFPMDRLLCGDVGFGKTEVALRALFKCVLIASRRYYWYRYHSRVAALQYHTAPHGGYHSQVEFVALHRGPAGGDFAALKAGRAGYSCRYHRLLQKGRGVKDLGLVIIDEEQRWRDA